MIREEECSDDRYSLTYFIQYGTNLQQWQIRWKHFHGGWIWLLSHSDLSQEKVSFSSFTIYSFKCPSTVCCLRLMLVLTKWASTAIYRADLSHTAITICIRAYCSHCHFQTGLTTFLAASIKMNKHQMVTIQTTRRQHIRFNLLYAAVCLPYMCLYLPHEPACCLHTFIYNPSCGWYWYWYWTF